MERVPADRHQRRPHRSRETRGRHPRLAGDAERGRALRPDRHAARPDLRGRGDIPADDRRRRRARRDRDRRHRAGSHRKGRRLPPGRDGVQGLPGHLPHGRDPAGRVAPAPRRSGGTRLRQPRLRDRGVSRRARVHHRRAAAGHLLRGRGEGDELERHRTGRRRRRRDPAVGVPALLQGGTAVDQLARPHVLRDAPGHRRRAPLARRPRARARCAWTRTASSASRRARRVCPRGRRGTLSRRRPTRSSRGWCARWAASPSRSST